MTNLKNNPTLKDYQDYILEMEKERGFADEGVREKCILLGEEVGELFKSIRKSTGIKTEKGKEVSPVSEELADVLIYICEIANRCGVDLEEAFRLKEAKNSKRVWA
jgi:NTP pyrophosphatase (non-canonical NTP hydrolase)